MQTVAAGEHREVRRRSGDARLAANTPRHPADALALPDETTSERTAPDWTGLPLRVVELLGRRRALALLDVPPLADGRSGRDFQEEYVEWRVVRANDAVKRVELTVELPERWLRLASDEPAEVLDLIARFAGVPTLRTAAAYGPFDPFAKSSTPAGRRAAFARTMLGQRRRSPYNDGRVAITCLTQRSNTLSALAALAAAALRPRFVRRPAAEPPVRSPTAGELIPLLGDAAQAGRGSDPVLVERFARLAFEDRVVAFADPAGLWIQGVQRTRLRTPAGDEVPPEWFTFSRPLAPLGDPPGPSRPQRLCFEVPKDEGFLVGDLVDVATGGRIRFGGQIAELVQLALPLAVSPAGSAPIDPPEELEPSRSAGGPPADDPELRDAATALLGTNAA